MRLLGVAGALFCGDSVGYCGLPLSFVAPQATLRPASVGEMGSLLVGTVQLCVFRQCHCAYGLQQQCVGSCIRVHDVGVRSVQVNAC
jgi:hypothetical protein